MASLSRVRVGWTGAAVVGPGVSTFYTAGDGATLQAALRTFFTAIGGSFPNLKGQWDFPSEGEVIDSATGELTGAWTGATAASIPWSSNNAVWVNGVGTRIVWNTSGFLRGRRVRGSTFLVPLSLATYDTDGTIAGAVLTQLKAAADALIEDVPELTVFSRPTAAGGNGGSTPVTAASVPDKISWLRSRRT